MTESTPSSENPIAKIRRELVTKVISPIGRTATEGARGNLKRAREGAKDANELTDEYEERLRNVSRIVAKIAAKSATSTNWLRAADQAQNTALDTASTVLNGTRNGNARDALETMEKINRDTPALAADMNTLRDQSSELQDGLWVAGMIAEEAIDQSSTNLDVTFAPVLTSAPKVVKLVRNYVDHL